ncbi:hypothetical protein [Mycobacterium sp. C31M]
MPQRAINSPAHADAGVKLTQQMVGVTKYGDTSNPIIYGPVSGPTLARALVDNISRLGESGQRDDGLFMIDFGGIQMFWILQSTGNHSCASFFKYKVIDSLSATMQLRRLLDGLSYTASALGCTADYASDGQVDSAAATIIESGRTMMVRELFA